jgi:hypothetical protein
MSKSLRHEQSRKDSRSRQAGLGQAPGQQDQDLQQASGHHRQAGLRPEQAIVAGSTLAISAVTWAELLNGAHLGHIDQGTLRGFIAEFGIAILPVKWSKVPGVSPRIELLRERKA